MIFTARSAAAGDEVIASIGDVAGSVTHRMLHLDDLRSVRSFGAALRRDVDRLDVMVNNAGVVMQERRETKDGFELTFGVNHLGHFALVKRAFPAA